MPSQLQMQLEASRLLRWTFAIASGAMLGFSFPDWNITVLAFIALGPLICASVSSPGRRSAFCLGWLGVTVTWLINVPWVIEVMRTHGGIPASIGIILWIALAGYLGLYGGVFALLIHALRPGRVLGMWLLIPLAWAATEFARAHLFSGYPWNLVAQTIVDLPLVMPASIIGPYGVGALVVAPSAVLSWLLMRKASTVERAAGALGLVAFVVTWGALAGWMFVEEEKAIARDASRTVALLQPGISQEMRWSPTMVSSIFDRMTLMTEDASQRGASVVIWPESTVPLAYESTPFYREWVEQKTKDAGIDIVLGSVAVDSSNADRVWNSAFLAENGRTVGRYDKVRLVPWGEYVPMRRMLFFAKKLVKEVGEFAPGDRVFPLEGRFRYGIAICYEILFPGLAREQIRAGADLLVTVTNDGWFGESAALRQHLNGARLRAVETERWLVRAATTGISAAIDPTGRIVSELEAGRRGVVYAGVASRQSITPYVRFGDWFAMFAMFAIGVAIVVRKGSGK